MSTKKKKRKNEDEEWFPEQKKVKEKIPKSKDHCAIHCTNSTEKLTKLPSRESYEKLLYAGVCMRRSRVFFLKNSKIQMKT